MLFYHFWFILWTGKIAFFGLWFFTISICFSDCVWLCFCFWNLLSPFRILLQKCLIWRVLFLSIFTKNHCYYTRRMSSPTLCVASKPVKLCNAPHGRTDTHTHAHFETLRINPWKLEIPQPQVFLKCGNEGSTCQIILQAHMHCTARRKQNSWRTGVLATKDLITFTC